MAEVMVVSPPLLTEGFGARHLIGTNALLNEIA